uniref:Uncharacterized protein n=1 Tax=virus sp. ctiha2 TaxID=2827299 RepID=A0A8S5RGP2_9VIRU|nr:MAG TPA: hypothetical protein [virus sp. ctiha2]
MELVGYEDDEAGSLTSFSSWVVHPIISAYNIFNMYFHLPS